MVLSDSYKMEKKKSQISEEDNDSLSSISNKDFSVDSSLISGLKNLELNFNCSISNSNSNSNSIKITHPYAYQEEIFQKIKDKNSIIFMETGKGKTYIAIMLIKHLLQKEENNFYPKVEKEFTENNFNLLNQYTIDDDFPSEKPLNIKDKIRLRNNLNNKSLVNLKENNKIFKHKTKCIFLVTESILVEQQKNQLKKNLENTINTEQIKSAKYKSKKEFNKFWEESTVFISTPVILFNLLSYGYLKISDIDLLIFDECHHADKKSAYFLIMNEFYFFHKESEEYKLPKLPQILGLTASPLKKKIKQDIEITGRQALENISNNLNCEMVIDPDVMEYNYDELNKDDNIKNINSADAKREYVEVQNHKNLVTYQLVENLLIEFLYNKITDLCFKKYPLLAIVKKEDYYKYIKEKAKCQDVMEYNKITAKEQELFELRIKYPLFNVLEKLQRQVLMIVENLDFESIENLIKEYMEMYKNEWNKLFKEKDEIKKNKKFEIEMEEIKKLHGIFKKFLEISKENSIFYTSPRLEQLKEKIKEIVDKDIKYTNNHRIIIFVQNRIVSELLSKFINNYLDKEFNFSKETRRNQKEYKCNYVVGVNKSKNQNAFNSSISISKLNENLEDFKKGNCQILIGTSTVEEGIDVSQCDYVIVYTLLKTAKSYIQMKGRARKANATFSIFTENKNQMIQSIKDFVDLIIFIRKQFNNNSILKDFRTNLNKRKFILQKNEDYFVIKNTMAKVTINNAKMIYNEIMQRVYIKDPSLEKVETYEEKRMSDLSGSPLYYKCIFRIRSRLIKFDHKSDYKTNKDISFNNCLVWFIWYMHEVEILDDNLNILL